uniref:Response regulatory domain-containing protein n=1 Tax=Arcella intermedia TaxID=1963864 RepID=A0A6B2LRZ3_9EUKA
MLVVEDSQSCRELTKKIVQHEGYEVETARDGLEGCKMVESDPGRYHLVLMDVVMPVMNGIVATERLRKQGISVPIVPLTGVPTEEMRQDCELAGMTGYLTKPLTVPKLRILMKQTKSLGSSSSTDF